MRFTHGLVFVGGGRHGLASAHDLASIRDLEKTTATIATRMCTSQQETSSLLKHLTDARYLRTARHPRDWRLRLYTICEGFFDVWLAINLSPGARIYRPFLHEFYSLSPAISADRGACFPVLM